MSLLRDVVISLLRLLFCATGFYLAVIAAVSHLFPFRTEQLSPLAPMVLQCDAGE